MILPDESRDQIGTSQEIWNWLVHPPPQCASVMVDLAFVQ